MQAGLGIKSIDFNIDNEDADMFHATLLDTYPKLSDARGWGHLFN